MTVDDNRLRGLEVLVVEDEATVAFWLEMLLEELGCSIVGPAARVSEALSLLEARAVDVAVLDVNLAGETVFPVADKLAALGIPFLFATGYGTAGLVDRHRDRNVLQKPYTQETLRVSLENLAS